MANTKITNPELFNLGDSTSATQLPVMTTTQRIAMNAAPITPFNIDYLVVAGGGGGGPGYQAGGGGAGGMRTSFGTGNINGGLTAVENSLTLATATSYTINVGAAGTAGAGSFPSTNRGGTGGDSEINGTGITTITSQGGGGGASYNNYNQGGLNLQGSPGGSGGGSAPHGSQPTATGGVRVTNPIQGFDGGDSLSYATPYYGAGGGGAGGAGGVSNGANTGLGGLGLESAITGVNTFYAGGGGGGSYYSTGGAPGVGGSGVGGDGGTRNPSLNAAGAGATNTGSGGGGGSDNGYVGGAGGSGIVILRYPTADVASYTATGLTPTETTVGTDTILSFTTVGTGTITFTSSTPTSTISTGEMIFNSTTDKVEYFDGTKWYGITYESTGETPYNNVLYTGNGSARSITGVGFEPDLVWIKKRNSASYSSHMLFDTVRGVDKVIRTDSTAAEYDGTGTGYQTSFNTDGFSITGNLFVNQSGDTFVAWCFKAGGTAVANTDGTVASQVSANVIGGFSIVKYTGGALIGNTVGHGLSSPPEMIIQKATSTTRNWNVFNYLITGNLHLNLADAANTSEYWAVNSNTFAIQDQSASENRIAYCFHSVAGYSKVGSYTGNGSSTGTIVTLDFAPSFVMIKGTDQTSDWIMIDNKRDTTNPNSARLDANSAGAEYNGENIMDLNSNGFQLKTSSASKNGLNKVFIYMAFA
jgi:hypothetical protein